jgi:hypothetical protein
MIIYDSYSSFDIYVNQAADDKARLTKLKAIIDALYGVAMTAAADENITEYILDDGQTKIQCNYRGVDAIMKTITGLEKIQQRLMNKLMGRVFRLQDGKSFNQNPYNNGRY